jgi:uncharacterized protein
MNEILPGRINQLTIARMVDFGAYLNAGAYGEILMPAKYLAPGAKPGDTVEAFLYCDSDDRMVATTEKPFAQVGELAWLRCTAVSRFGAFMNWGLLKDLLVPFREQTQPMKEGNHYAVYIYLDEKSGRIAGSAHIDKFLSKGRPLYQAGDKVAMFIYGKTDLGYKVAVDNQFSGLLYFNEVFMPLQIGESRPGFVRQVREDGKIDLRLHREGYESVSEVSDSILEKLRGQGGFMPYTDNSEPEAIYQAFGMSKKQWKKAVGALYRRRLIHMDTSGISLLAED